MTARGAGWRTTVVSIDRIDNMIGYEIGNVWAICHSCNRRKAEATLPWLKRLVAALEQQQKTQLREVG
jgi:hypothetical protein